MKSREPDIMEKTRAIDAMRRARPKTSNKADVRSFMHVFRPDMSDYEIEKVVQDVED